MDIKNKSVGVVEMPLSARVGGFVLFDRATFEPGRGKEVPFMGAHRGMEEFLTRPIEAAPSVALKIAGRKDPALLPGIITSIDQMRQEAQIEDAMKLGTVREKLKRIQEGIEP